MSLGCNEKNFFCEKHSVWVIYVHKCFGEKKIHILHFWKCAFLGLETRDKHANQ